MGFGLHGVLISAFFLLTSCGRAPGFLHHVQDTALQQYSDVHSLKQLQGQRKVDILWVIDNSASMGSHQANLIKNADLFINDFVAKGGLEWKMGVLSTSIAQPPLAGFTPTSQLNHQQPDGVSRFQAAIRRLGIGGDSSEQSFGPIKKQLDLNPGFLRPEATLAVIFISDAAEQSRMSGTDLLRYLRGLKNADPKKVIAYGVLTPNELKCNVVGEDRWDYAGSTFEEVIGGTKGKLFKLCGDFGQNLSDLGRDLITRIERPFIALKERPNTSTIRVMYKGKVLGGGMPEEGGYWIYDFDLNRIVFHNLAFAPGDTEEVTITYSN